MTRLPVTPLFGTECLRNRLPRTQRVGSLPLRPKGSARYRIRGHRRKNDRSRLEAGLGAPISSPRRHARHPGLRPGRRGSRRAPRRTELTVNPGDRPARARFRSAAGGLSAIAMGSRAAVLQVRIHLPPAESQTNFRFAPLSPTDGRRRSVYEPPRYCWYRTRRSR